MEEASSSADRGGDGRSTMKPTEDDARYNGGVQKKARLEAMLVALLNDPILADIPKKPSLAQVETLINLELGSAMKISVVKMDSTSFDVVVLDTATVKDLKLAIQTKTDDMQQEQLGHRHISWRQVWAKFCLSHNNVKLIDDRTLLRHFCIRNNAQVHFTPYIATKASRRHSRRRKHRFFHGLSNKLS